MIAPQVWHGGASCLVQERLPRRGALHRRRRSGARCVVAAAASTLGVAGSGSRSSGWAANFSASQRKM